MNLKTIRQYIQEVTFGLEDSLVSTVGAVTGMAVGSENRALVILAGLIIIFVEATSMAAGSYLSDRVKHDTDRAAGRDPRVRSHRPVVAGAIMGVSYLLAGVVPLAPYALLPLSVAAPVSIGLTLAALFLVGVWQTAFTKRAWYKSGGEMFIVGGAAIMLGFVVGRVASQLLGIEVYEL